MAQLKEDEWPADGEETTTEREVEPRGGEPPAHESTTPPGADAVAEGEHTESNRQPARPDRTTRIK